MANAVSSFVITDNAMIIHDALSSWVQRTQSNTKISIGDGWNGTRDIDSHVDEEP